MSEHGQQKDEPIIRSDSLNALYPGRFLRAEDLGGKEQTITIRDIYAQSLEGKDSKKKQKTILLFDRKTPGACEIVLAKINAVAIRTMFGDNVKDIIGKRITIYGTNKLMPMMVGENAGKPCIRIMGSPDIAEPMQATFSPARRRPVTMTLQPTGKKTTTGTRLGNAPPPQARPDVAERDAEPDFPPEPGSDG